MEISKIAKQDDAFPMEKIVDGKLVQTSSFKVSLEDMYDKKQKKEILDSLRQANINYVWVVKSFNALALVLSAYCTYYSIVYGIKILGIPW